MSTVFENSDLNTKREALLRKPYRIIDIMPARTPARFASAYHAVVRYLFRDPILSTPYERFFNLLLKLSCYCDIAVCRPDDEKWLCSPEPEFLSERFREIAESRKGGLHFLIDGGKLLITLDACDLYMTAYGTSPSLLRRFKQLARSEGLFVWKRS